MAKFSSDLGGLVDPGAYCSPLDLRNHTTDDLVNAYRRMRLIRSAEEAIAGLVESGKAVCPCHLAIGQEAVPAGLAQHLTADDRSYGAHRSHGHYLALGGDVNALFAEVLGKDTGCSGGMGGSMHLFSEENGFGGSVPIVAGTVPVAVGAALAFKLRKKPSVAVAFFGDGACEEGVIHESLNLASTMNLPVVFVVENNLFSSHLDINLRQPSDSVARFAHAHKIPAMTVDGNDVVVCSDSAKSLIGAARRGEGPGFLEAVTYRWRGHVGHREDIDVGLMRSADMVAKWKQRDPILRLRVALETSRDKATSILDAVDAQVSEAISSALAYADSSPYPQSSALLDRVYAPTEGADS